MQIKAILFDMDGVILDSEKVYYQCWEETAKAMGYSIPRASILQLRSCDSSIARQIVDSATGTEGAYDIIRAERKVRMRAYMADHDLELKPGVKKFLEQIKPLSIKKYIVTASSPEEKLPILEKTGISQYFDDIVSAKDVKRNKPYPDIYLAACKKIGIDPSECIAIEDAPNGIRSAYSAGIKVFMVPDLTQADEELQKISIVVDRIDDIVRYIIDA